MPTEMAESVEEAGFGSWGFVRFSDLEILMLGKRLC